MKHQEDTHEKSNVALSEEKILAFWRDKKIFEQSVNKKAPLGDFVFYDGPPFATGLPHYGHLLAGAIKDVIPRFKTMQGYRVPRVWGWDCHGLPIENLIEKELGLATKKDIEAYGIEKFNQAARDSVLRYEKEWKEYVPRFGRWIDMEHPYMSMDASYMESVWWVFSQLHQKSLTKEGFKSIHLCPRCETTLANFEVNQGYKDVTDISVTAKFALVDEADTFFLAWTTTPWTLPGNVALAVGADIDYLKVQHEGAYYILAEALCEQVFAQQEYTLIDRMKGHDLVGTAYLPLFDYYQQQEDLEHKERGWKVYAASFVSTEEGTGIVHVAPGYGSDDLMLGQEEQLPFIQHVAKNGSFLDDFALTVDGVSFQGMLVKKKDDLMSTDIEVIKYLAHHTLLFSKHKLVHSYPHCWRCDTPLLNYATSSWYVDVPQLKDRLLAANSQVAWVPEHVGEGRFGKWLEGARDWALSRSRFWGTPLPVWRHPETDELSVFGSVKDLLLSVQRSGNRYYGFRHGEAVSNVSGVVNTDPSVENPLTEKGRASVEAALADLPSDIDMIFVSPFQRTEETAMIVKEHLGLADDAYIVDERLRENRTGAVWEGKAWSEYHAFKYPEDLEYLDAKAADDAESLRDLYQRVASFLFDLEERYHNKKILIVSHGGPLRMMQFIVEHHGMMINMEEFFEVKRAPKNADLFDLDFFPFPHNESYELDLHRPYIDDLPVVDSKGTRLSRVEDVFDVWFDSGSMPYAQIHYPFEQGNDFTDSRFPAEYIAEGLDQTRGWFYVLSVLGMALFDTIPFKHVIVNGLILAEDGKKMSKKLKNYPDPYELFDTLGADALRFYLLASPAVRAEEFAFSEKSVRELGNKVMGRLRNIQSLYTLYADECDHEGLADSPYLLDQWIINEWAFMEVGVRESLTAYEIDRAARGILDFVDSFSTWYIRRSRDRFKGDDQDEKKWALASTRFLLKQTALVIAPFAPFVAEEIWQGLGYDTTEEISVHLASWPEARVFDEQLRLDMQSVRDLISQALQLRSEAKIKVRQVLASVSLPVSSLDDAYQTLVKEELNVHAIIFDRELALDTKLTPELIAEGQMREFIRAVQNMRKEKGLDARDEVSLKILTDDAGEVFIDRFKEEIQKTAGIAEIIFEKTQGETIDIDDLHFVCGI